MWLLQARAITASSGFPDGGDASTVWSRANVGEALPGAATPLTWSVARAFAETGFRDAFEALGCKVPKGVVLVASVKGRFYLNLTQFSRIAAQVPGMTPRALLGTSGGARPAVVDLLERQVEGVSKRRFLLRAPLVAPRLLARQHRLQHEIGVYEPWAEKQRRRLTESGGDPRRGRPAEPPSGRAVRIVGPRSGEPAACPHPGRGDGGCARVFVVRRACRG